MHLYWRIQNDLDCLGEVIYFHDPGLIRCLHRWVRKNMAGLVMAHSFYRIEKPSISLN